LRFLDGKATAKILSRGKTPVPNQQEPARVGDTQLVAEVNVPAGVTTSSLAFVVVSPAGESPPHRLLVEGKATVISEKEPNNGCRQAQPIRLPQAIDGVIDPLRDVDVFRFDGKAGQGVDFEVQAARYGSALDSVLTLYDADGHEVASNDDGAG